MSKRSLIVVAVILGVAAFLVQFFSWPSKGPRDNRVGATLADAGLVESIDAIVIEANDSSIHLQKADDLWRVEEKDGFPANVKNILTLLEKLSSYKIASIVTENPERLGHFKLNYETETENQENRGSQLTLMAKDKPIYTLLVGKHRDSISKSSQAPSHPDGTYIRIGDKNSVILIKENLDLTADADSWIRKELISIDSDQIKAIRCETQKGRIELSRESKEKDLILSGLGKGEKTSDYERRTLLTELKNLTVDNIKKRDKRIESGLEMKSSVSVKLFNNSSFDFQVLAEAIKDPLKNKKEEKRVMYYLKVEPAPSENMDQQWKTLYSLADNWIFKIDDWRAKKWLKSKEDFIEQDKKTE